MTKLALTDLAIRKLPHPDRGQKTYWDRTTPGFGIRLSQRSKSFVVMRGRERHLTTIGSYPSRTLQEARSVAKRLLVQKLSEKGGIPFADTTATYLEEAQGRLRPATLSHYRHYLGRLDYSGRLDGLTRAKIKEFVSDPHGIVAVKVFLNWCIQNDHLDRNPLQNDRQHAYRGKKRVLTADQLKQIWAYEDGDFSRILKLLILLGQRKTETSLISDAWIEEPDLIRIPGEVAKNHQEHLFPFGALAKQYLPVRPFRGWSKAKARMDKVVKIPHWTIHNLRHTFRTIHSSLGTPPHIGERMLNHISHRSEVERIYDQYAYLPEMREACERYEAHIKSVVLAEDAAELLADGLADERQSDLSHPEGRQLLSID